MRASPLYAIKFPSVVGDKNVDATVDNGCPRAIRMASGLARDAIDGTILGQPAGTPRVRLIAGPTVAGGKAQIAEGVVDVGGTGKK